MKGSLTLVIFLVSLGTIRADEVIAKAQQALKDQGFYYGEVTGEKNTATNDAIRRYQIRNGLQITGELNDETLRSLQSTASASPSPSDRSVARTVPSPNADTSDLRDESARTDPGTRSVPVQPFNQTPSEGQPEVPNSGVRGRAKAISASWTLQKRDRRFLWTCFGVFTARLSSWGWSSRHRPTRLGDTCRAAIITGPADAGVGAESTMAGATGRRTSRARRVGSPIRTKQSRFARRRPFRRLGLLVFGPKRRGRDILVMQSGSRMRGHLVGESQNKLCHPE